MKLRDEFRIYLTTVYRGPRSGKPYSLKLASDALSRCRRIEEILGIELSGTTIRPDRAFQRIEQAIRQQAGNFRSGSPHPYTHLQAIRLYREFLLSRP